MKFRVLRAQESFKMMSLNCRPGSALPALRVYTIIAQEIQIEETEMHITACAPPLPKSEVFAYVWG